MDTEIQIDMFEVQLGSALFFQFKTKNNDVVRVLADAGISAAGYPKEHVRDKLPGAINSDDKRIDLIIGTHYDADHLDGLVPIINDLSINIGEAWLPPVANDTEVHPAEERVADFHILANQFAANDGEAKLRAYLYAKQQSCEELRILEHNADEFRPGKFERSDIIKELNIETRLDSARAYFEGHVSDALITLGLSSDEFNNLDVEPSKYSRFKRRPQPRDEQGRFMTHDFIDSYGFAGSEFFQYRWCNDRSRADSDARTLAYIRLSAAKDAINATSLAEVVSALRSRNIPICCRIIQDGTPQKFVWRSSDRKFVPGRQLVSEGPELMLLGPSEGLVKKHWAKLPIGDYINQLSFLRVSVKSITPSNQLSYILRMSFNGQGILVTGDSGCVDFKQGNGKYFSSLLNLILPLHVIQVAHHGGNNAHFYNVLLDAGYPAQTDHSLLLLSHATEDRYRPSMEFNAFITESRKPGDDMKLLFTSRPSLNKVSDYKEIIHPPVGTIGNVGDVRLSYTSNNWTVEKHAIRL